MRHEIEIDEDQFARAMLPDVGGHFGHWLLERLASPSRGYDAEVAAMHAAARRLENVAREEMPARKQISTRKRTSADLQPGRLIVARLEFARRKFAQQLRPGVFGVTNDNRIGARLRVLGNERHMRTAEHDRDSTPAKMIGELVRPRGCAGNH